MRSSRYILVVLLAAHGAACKSTRTVKSGIDETVDNVRTRGSAPPVKIDAAITTAATATSHALDESSDRAVGWRTLPKDANWKSILNSQRVPEGSFSSGTVANGALLEAAELPTQGEFHSIIERHRRHKTRWGTQELVSLIQSAAKHVYLSDGGAPLRVGNMSAKKGGDIRWSRSHNSGRDADLAFYVVDATNGESVPAPDLLRFDEKGIPKGREDLRFDVTRNWRLVEGMLSQTEINVQWLFISIPLKEMLLAEGARLGASPEVLRRAAQVLHQPTDALPHADHFHLRIGCSPDDRLDGCLDYGPQWDWLDWHRMALLARSLEVSKAFAEGSTRDRERALEFLTEIQSPYTADVAGVWGFWDEDPGVRRAALDAADSQYTWTANALVQLQKLISASQPGVREQRVAYSILRRSRDPLSRDFALARLIDATNAAPERVLAAKALTHFMELPLVAPLIEQLADGSPAVREAAAEVLRRITNRSEGVDWSGGKPNELAAAQQRWKAWWSEHETYSRETLLARGFAAMGVSVGDELTPQNVDALVELLESDAVFARYNANRTIREITGRWAPLEQEDGRALKKYWEKWWKKNRQRVLAGELGGDS